MAERIFGPVPSVLRRTLNVTLQLPELQIRLKFLPLKILVNAFLSLLNQWIMIHSELKIFGGFRSASKISSSTNFFFSYHSNRYQLILIQEVWLHSANQISSGMSMLFDWNNEISILWADSIVLNYQFILSKVSPDSVQFHWCTQDSIFLNVSESLCQEIYKWLSEMEWQFRTPTSKSIQITTTGKLWNWK